MRNEYNSSVLVSRFRLPMPDIIQSLHGRDIGHLRIVARLWGIDLVATDPDTVLKDLHAALLDSKLVAEIVDSLPPTPVPRSMH